MSDPDPQWKRVGRYISDRITALSLSKAEVQRKAHVSDKTLKGYLEGKPVVRVDKKRDLCDVLAWSRDSIDRIYRGGEPVLLDDPKVEAARTAFAGQSREEILSAIYGDGHVGDDYIDEALELPLSASRASALERFRSDPVTHLWLIDRALQTLARRVDALGGKKVPWPRLEEVEELIDTFQLGSDQFAQAAHGGAPESVEDESDTLSNPVSGFDPDEEEP